MGLKPETFNSKKDKKNKKEQKTFGFCLLLLFLLFLPPTAFFLESTDSLKVS
jgi:hypothetical protein